MRIRESRYRSRTAATAGLLFLVAVPGALVVGEEPAPPLKISLRRDGDQAETKAEKGIVTIAIRSPFGIGKATVERTGDAWPKEMRVRLHLRGLEHFSASAGDVGVAASLPSIVDASGSAIGQTPEAKGPSDDPLNVEIRSLDEQGREIKQIPPGGSFELRLPTALFEKNPKTIELEWVDFYRG